MLHRGAGNLCRGIVISSAASERLEQIGQIIIIRAPTNWRMSNSIRLPARQRPWTHATTQRRSRDSLLA